MRGLDVRLLAVVVVGGGGRREGGERGKRKDGCECRDGQT